MSQVINRNNYSSQRSSYLRFISTALEQYDNKKTTIEEKRLKGESDGDDSKKGF